MVNQQHPVRFVPSRFQPHGSRHRRAGRRRPWIRTVWAGALLLLPAPGALAWQQQAPWQRTPNPEPPAAEQVIQAQLEAFNAHDVRAMTANLAPDFVWYAVDSDNVTIALRGREAFESSMLGYFQSYPTARAEIEQTIPYGHFVAVQERSYWMGPDGQEHSQSALAVYEVVQGHIHRVWYYPAQE